MYASELINLLQEKIDQYGDMPVEVWEELLPADIQDVVYNDDRINIFID